MLIQKTQEKLTDDVLSGEYEKHRQVRAAHLTVQTQIG